MNRRTTLAALVAIGFLATMIGLPTASADTTVPGEDTYPGECAQVYIIETSLGPVTVDASDSCVQVIVEDTATASDDKFPPTVCIHPFGC